MAGFGRTLARMRRQRGFSSRDSLAAATGLSPATIANAERSETCRLYKDNAAKVIAVLGSTASFTPDEVEWWAQETGLAVEYVFKLAGATAPPEDLALPRQKTAVTLRFQSLLDVLGPEFMSTVFDFIEKVKPVKHLDPGLPDDEEPRLLNIHEPPVQHDGYYEEVIRTVEVVDKTPKSEDPPGDSTQKRGDGAG